MSLVLIVGHGTNAVLLAKIELAMSQATGVNVVVYGGGRLESIPNFETCDMPVLEAMRDLTPMSYGSDRPYLRKKKGRS